MVVQVRLAAGLGSLQKTELTMETTARKESIKTLGLMNRAAAPWDSHFIPMNACNWELKPPAKLKLWKEEEIYTHLHGEFWIPQDRPLTHPAGTVVCQDALAIQIFHMNAHYT